MATSTVSTPVVKVTETDAEEELTSCPICLEKYGNSVPKVFPCQHLVCRNCVERLFKDSNKSKCPMCNGTQHSRRSVTDDQRYKTFMSIAAQIKANVIAERSKLPYRVFRTRMCSLDSFLSTRASKVFLLEQCYRK